MTDYIAEFLATNNRLIVPDLGAFIAKQGSVNDFAFNEFLRYNDGLLAEYVAKKEQIAKEDALRKIGEFVKKMSATLTEGEKVAIGSLGFLQKDSSGKVNFEKSFSATTVERPVVISIPDMPEKPAAAPATPPKKDEKPTPIPTPVAKPAEVPVAKVEDKPVEKPVEKPIVKTADKPVAESASPAAGKEPVLAAAPKVSAPPVTPVADMAKKTDSAPTNPPAQATPKTAAPAAEKPKEAVAKATAPASKPYQNYSSANPQNKSNMSRILWIFIILLLIGGAVIYVLNNKSRFFKPKAQPVTEVVADTTAMDSTLTEEPVEPAPADYQPADNKPTGVQFYVVAGCFRVEQNADNYVRKLETEGYKARKFGQYKGLHAVCFDSFADYGPALNMLRDIRNGREPYAWILKY